ncbi:hypothetical protein EDB74_105258 [Vibrio crassostreae]|nr:hypothetical protein EDB74_105258 [Vibrio crassostreae]CAH7255959.1 hypothetical protein VCHA37P199_30290 [Vibrio chagasii]
MEQHTIILNMRTYLLQLKVYMFDVNTDIGNLVAVRIVEFAPVIHHGDSQRTA